jgi:hypothetical protein
MSCGPRSERPRRGHIGTRRFGDNSRCGVSPVGYETRNASFAGRALALMQTADRWAALRRPDARPSWMVGRGILPGAPFDIDSYMAQGDHVAEVESGHFSGRALGPDWFSATSHPGQWALRKRIRAPHRDPDSSIEQASDALTPGCVEAVEDKARRDQA